MKNVLIMVFALCTVFLGNSTTVIAADYLIGKGDVLEVAVWGVPEMSRSVTVRPDGKITLPAVGDIVADKITPVKLSDTIAAVMKKFIKHPVVTVSVEQIRNNRVYVTGGNVSRVVGMTTQMSLLTLLSALGDFSNADLRSAYLSRNGKKIVTNIYALYFQGDLSQDVDLKANDIIFIPSNANNIVYVLGAVTNPQPIHYTEGMRVLDAIFGAGGFTEFAKEKAVTIIKRNKNKIKIDLKKVRQGKNIEDNITLSPGDYVIVEESLF
ncbi:MAG: polysaccharide biosynthesis/export family protein [Desulfuromonadales bacterium]|nr:polysaccharide biosynthesis/export family protein [Desulfuromonadales bacterium]